MPRFIIEREIAGAGQWNAAELQAVAKKSCDVLRAMNGVQWQESFVTADKIYCVYIAPNEEAVREHARRGGFPANSVAAVLRVFDPTTEDAPVQA